MNEMNRREFFKNAFALGSIAIVPYSIFKGIDNQKEEWKEITHDVELNFGDYKAILVRGDKVVAMSHNAEFKIKREVIDVTKSDSPIDKDGYTVREFIQGSLSYDIKMLQVECLSNPKILRNVLESGEKLTIYIKDKHGDKYAGECLMIALSYEAPVNESFYIDIHLISNGDFIKEIK